MNERQFLIWSFEHDAWWAPGEVGYTRELYKAGAYPARRAHEIVARANVVAIHECLIPQDCALPAGIRLQGWYVITEIGGRPGIMCLRCKRTSFHPTDVAQRYCGHCHVFHEDPR